MNTSLALRLTNELYAAGFEEALTELTRNAPQVEEGGDVVALRVPIENFRMAQEALDFGRNARREVMGFDS